MSAPSSTLERDGTPPEPDDPGPEESTGAAAAATSGERRVRLFNRAGLAAAPVLIGVLTLLLFVYYRSQTGPSSVMQVRSALAWRTKLRPEILQHLEIALGSTVLVVVVAIPLGILLTRRAFRRIAPWVLVVANSGQALPAYGLLVIFLILLGQTRSTAIYAFAFYALLPVLRNTMVGLDAVDPNVIEAGRGMGMTRRQALTRIELPLAVPIILAGVRTAVVLNIGMATLAFLIGGGGLGIAIDSGLKNQQNAVMIVGAWLVALIALTFDWFGALAERILRPRGI